MKNRCQNTHNKLTSLFNAIEKYFFTEEHLSSCLPHAAELLKGGKGVGLACDITQKTDDLQ